jgi:hypothetical protein
MDSSGQLTESLRTADYGYQTLPAMKCSTRGIVQVYLDCDRKKEIAFGYNGYYLGMFVYCFMIYYFFFFFILCLLFRVYFFIHFFNSFIILVRSVRHLQAW